MYFLLIPVKRLKSSGATGSEHTRETNNYHMFNGEHFSWSSASSYSSMSCKLNLLFSVSSSSLKIN